MFKKVSSHLSSLATPFLNDLNGAISSLTGQNAGISGQQGKVAAQLLKKSPFEKMDSPMEALKKDPLGFSQVQYPADLTNNEQGHYILFYTLQNSYGNTSGTDFALANRMGLTEYGDDEPGDGPSRTLGDLRARTGGVSAVKLDNSVYSELPTHSKVTSAIALYMPPGVKVSYKNNYEAEATELSGDVANMVGNLNSAQSLSEQIGAVAGGLVGGIGQYGKNVIGEAVSMVGAGDPVRVASKALGVAVNPREEQFYVGPDFRTFGYSFDFWPRNQKELEAANNIIMLFKYHSHPSLEQSNSKGRMFFVPSEFEIHYMHQGKENRYMNKISKCVCTSVDVDYGPEGEFKAFADSAAPIHYKLTLGFTELEFMTKDKIFRGY